jgi:hypothetical protein
MYGFHGAEADASAAVRAVLNTYFRKSVSFLHDCSYGADLYCRARMILRTAFRVNSHIAYALFLILKISSITDFIPCAGIAP